MQKTNAKEFRVEKLIKRKCDQLCVKWEGYKNSFDSCIDKKNIFIYEISYFPPYSYRKSKIEAKLDFSNYATKFDLKMQ